MPNLLETIQANRANLQAERAGVTDETARTAGLLRARSGRAGVSPDLTTSNLAEQSAVAGTNAQLEQQGAAIGRQGAQDDLAARKQELDAEQRQAGIEQARRFNTVESRMKSNQILSDLERDKGNIDLARDGARLEQVGFLLSMQDEKYVNDLTDVARRRRLDDATRTQQELAELTFGQKLSLLQDKLEAGDILAASDREYRRALSELTLRDALAMAEIDLDTANQQMSTRMDNFRYDAGQAAKQANSESLWQGVSGVVKGGISAYGTYQDQVDRSGGNDPDYQAYVKKTNQTGGGVKPLPYSNYLQNKSRLD